MHDRSSNTEKNEDPAASMVSQMVDAARLYPNKNPAAVALGRLGGIKGGKARAASLTPKRRSQIARKAANKRWEILSTVKKGIEKLNRQARRTHRKK